MGHCWPGTAFCPFGNGSVDVIANDVMLDMFQEYTLP
jgi:hypothetical protein